MPLAARDASAPEDVIMCGDQPQRGVGEAIELLDVEARRTDGRGGVPVEVTPAASP